MIFTLEKYKVHSRSEVFTKNRVRFAHAEQLCLMSQEQTKREYL